MNPQYIELIDRLNAHNLIFSELSWTYRLSSRANYPKIKYSVYFY